jgi:hypothetical protein
MGIGRCGVTYVIKFTSVANHEHSGRNISLCHVGSAAEPVKIPSTSEVQSQSSERNAQVRQKERKT